MNARRIFTLIKKEFLYGSKNFIFVMALVMPVVITLVISLLVGTLFAGKPRLGIFDQGQSKLPDNMEKIDFFITKIYASEAQLVGDVERGALDMGLVLHPGFDSQLQSAQEASLDLMIWGESLLKHRDCAVVRQSRWRCGYRFGRRAVQGP